MMVNIDNSFFGFRFSNLLCKDVDPIVQLVPKGLDITQTLVFRLKHGLISNIEVEEPLLS